MYHIQYIDDLQWIIRKIQNLYKVHITTTSPDRIGYFRNFALFTEILFKVMSILYFPPILVFMSYPIYVYVTTNQLVPIIPLYVPMIDETTIVGFIILAIYHIINIILGTLGLIAIDYFMAIVITSSLIFAKLISADLQQINCDLMENDSRLMAAKARFRNIFWMHQEMGG